MMFNFTHVLFSLFMVISSVMVLFTTIFKVREPYLPLRIMIWLCHCQLRIVIL